MTPLHDTISKRLISNKDTVIWFNIHKIKLPTLNYSSLAHITRPITAEKGKALSAKQ